MNRDNRNITEAYLKSRLLKENVEQEIPQSGPFQNYAETMDQNELKDFLTKLMDKNKEVYKIKYNTNKLIVRDSFNDENDPAGEVIMKGTRKDDGKWQIEYNGEYFSQKDWNNSQEEDNEGSDDDFDDTVHDDDPTGQDEPVDTRSYSDVRTSDRLDYANRMVRSGKWDRERAEEYKRGA